MGSWVREGEIQQGFGRELPIQSIFRQTGSNIFIPGPLHVIKDTIDTRGVQFLIP